MEPTEALQSAETILRAAIRHAFPEGTWLEAPGAPALTSLEGRRQNEASARDGARGSNDLLDYADTGHLAAVVEQNWDRFAPIFLDERRTRVYMDTLRSVRNTVAHSRPLVPFERDLLSGVAQHLGNLLALFRTATDGPHMHYPSVESLTDGLGTEGLPGTLKGPYEASSARHEVGDVVRFEGRATDPRGRRLRWFLGTGYPQFAEIGEGPSLSYAWTVEERHVGETTVMLVFVAAESRFHRHWWAGPTGFGYDDARHFVYSVSPPMED